MTDIITEVIRVALLAMIVVGLIIVGRRRAALAQPGWYPLLSGFGLLLFGCILDVTDNFESLNRFVVVGDTDTQAVLEKLVGFLGGFILLAVGLLRWLPNLTSIAELREAHHRLEEVNEQLRGADRAKSEFLANMSHEIRTPMTAILGYADLLDRDEDLSNDREQAADAINTIRINANHLLAIINDILDVSKIEAGRMTVEKIPTNPVQIVEEVASLIRPKAGSKGVELRVSYDTAIPERIESDPTRLRQILMNLVGNAVKFTESGSVTIHAACEFDSWLMRFQVVDTGVGMSPEQCDAIARFEAFRQADGATTRRFGGTGLGLRISNSLAQMLGGRIDIESRIGDGSKFTVTVGTGSLAGTKSVRPEQAPSLAQAEQNVREKQRQVDGEPDALKGVRILLAEDGPDNQRLIAFHLKKAGAEVAVAENGRIAVEQVMASAGRTPFDMVLMDMQMPELDGYGATRKLRQEEHHLPIIALTAHAMAGDRQKCLDAGCDDYLTKPIDKQALIRTCMAWKRRDLRATA